jgi:hypothetical protein
VIKTDRYMNIFVCTESTIKPDYIKLIYKEIERGREKRERGRERGREKQLSCKWCLLNQQGNTCEKSCVLIAVNQMIDSISFVTYVLGKLRKWYEMHWGKELLNLSETSLWYLRVESTSRRDQISQVPWMHMTGRHDT